jgi:3-phosphoshikimate 1-carboxyvinyltransferase
MSFDFDGQISASKSLLNRALIIQSYFPQLKVEGESQCADVKDMRLALMAMTAGTDVFCGDAGTVLRFMLFRCSRNSGKFKLVGSSRLLSRPHDDLSIIASQLGIQVRIAADGIEIQSNGWQDPKKTISISRKVSSQFASGLLLNAWNLDFDLDFEMEAGVSEGYWRMTVEMVRNMGMTVLTDGWRWKVPKGQKLNASVLKVEPDYSSAFAIGAAGALAGRAHIQNFVEGSLQPDTHGFEILGLMNAPVSKDKTGILVEKADVLAPIDASIENSPDLFPVLAVVCAFAEGTSVLTGGTHLVHKESNRIRKTAELLQKAGFKVETLNDGIKIYGRGRKVETPNFEYDPDHDHRMAMAAGLFILMGFPVKLLSPGVVYKSFPEFWQILGVQP